MTDGDPSRVERDSMGEMRVPAEARWGAQTQRAIENFPISGLRLERAQIEALARIKGAVAAVRLEDGVIEAELADAIIAAAEEVAGGECDDQFPIDVFQTGSGTSSNMNMNEVLASLAAERFGRPRPPERRRQPPDVVERHVPRVDPHRRRRRRASATSSPRSSTSPDRSSRRRPSSPVS